MLDLTPYLVLVVDVIAKFHHADAHPVLGRGGGLVAVYLSVGEKKAFQRFRHLLLYLLRGGAGKDSDHDALAYRGVWEFVLGHVAHAEDTQTEEN